MTKLTFHRLTVPGTLLAVALLLGACSSTAEDAAPTPKTEPAASHSTIPEMPPAFPEAVPLEVPLEAPSEVPEELKVVWEVWALLVREHYDRSNIDPELFAEAAINGLIDALGDPHSHYVRPGAFDIQAQDLEGKFEGIGANVSMRRDGKLIIVSPLEGSPAKAAGIRPGDVILEVNGESIEGLSLLEAVAMIRGRRGSQVVLLVQHITAIDPVTITVTRDVIPLTSVLLRSEPGQRIAHIRLINFFSDTAQILGRTINEAVESGAEALILDVRGNPGGLLTSAVDVVSQFIDGGLVLYEIDGSGSRKDWKASKGGVARDIPMVLLTNEFSASASEVVVGALQDHERATVVGATTFGKGSVNILRRLSNEGGLWITFARWFTPQGREIQGVGLEPDVEVVAVDQQTAEAKQVEAAVEVLESRLRATATGSGA